MDAFNATIAFGTPLPTGHSHIFKTVVLDFTYLEESVDAEDHGRVEEQGLMPVPELKQDLGLGRQLVHERVLPP